MKCVERSVFASRRPRSRWVGVSVVCLGLAAWGCASDDAPPVTDAGNTVIEDAGVVEDAGQVGICPADSNAACQAASECQPDPRTSPSACAWCPTTGNDALCLASQCATPPSILPTEFVDLAYAVTGLEGEVESFAGLAVAETTAGGAQITCEDVYEASPSIWTNPCYNILDVGYARRVGPTGQVYRMSFTQFASGQTTLFIVYGFGEDGAEGEPIGVTCTSTVIEAAGNRGREVQLPGDTMERIE